MFGTAVLKLYKEHEIVRGWGRPMPSLDEMPSLEREKPVAITTVTLRGGVEDFHFALVDEEGKQLLAPELNDDGDGVIITKAAVPRRCSFGRCPLPWMKFGTKLRVEAAITELATGEQQGAEAEVKTAVNIYNANFQLEQSFVPGLPLHAGLSLSKLDGTPAVLDMGTLQPLQPVVTVSFCSDPGKCPVPEQKVACALLNGQCSLKVVVPFEAEFVSFEVERPATNVLGSSSVGSPIQGISPSKSFLRVHTTGSVRPGSIVDVSVAATMPLTDLSYHVVASKKLVMTRTTPVLTSVLASSSYNSLGACACASLGKASLSLDAPPRPTEDVNGLTCQTSGHTYEKDGWYAHPFCLVANGACPDGVFQYWPEHVRGMYASKVACGHRHGTSYTSTFQFTATSDMISRDTRLLVYAVRADGEVVPHEIQLSVAAALNNEVTFGLAPGPTTPLLPGQAIELTVKSGRSSAAASFSLVGLYAIDKALLLMETDQRLTASRVLGQQADVLETDKIPFAFRSSTAAVRDAGVAMIIPENVTLPDQSGSPFAFANPMFGAMDDDGAGVFMMANKGQVARSGVVPGQATSETAAVRSYFPETWMWKSMVVPDGEEQLMAANAPDTITSWVLGAVAVSESSGLGISTTEHLTVFKPFFVELRLPFAVVRGEMVEVVVAVYNYQKGTSTDVTVTTTSTPATNSHLIWGKNTQQCIGASNIMLLLCCCVFNCMLCV